MQTAERTRTSATKKRSCKSRHQFAWRTGVVRSRNSPFQMCLRENYQELKRKSVSARARGQKRELKSVNTACDYTVQESQRRSATQTAQPQTHHVAWNTGVRRSHNCQSLMCLLESVITTRQAQRAKRNVPSASRNAKIPRG